MYSLLPTKALFSGTSEACVNSNYIRKSAGKSDFCMYEISEQASRHNQLQMQVQVTLYKLKIILSHDTNINIMLTFPLFLLSNINCIHLYELGIHIYLFRVSSFSCVLSWPWFFFSRYLKDFGWKIAMEWISMTSLMTWEHSWVFYQDVGIGFHNNMSKETIDWSQHSKIALSSISQGLASNTFSGCDLK